MSAAGKIIERLVEENAMLLRGWQRARHQAWCDAWLAIGLAAALAPCWFRDNPGSDDEAREGIAQAVGRVVRRRK